MQDTQKRTAFGPVGMILGGFLLVYFLCPVVFVLPAVAIYGRMPDGRMRAPPAVDHFFKIFFWPVECLSEHVPLYYALIEKEFATAGRWTGIR